MANRLFRGANRRRAAAAAGERGRGLLPETLEIISGKPPLVRVADRLGDIGDCQAARRIEEQLAAAVQPHSAEQRLRRVAQFATGSLDRPPRAAVFSRRQQIAQFWWLARGWLRIKEVSGIDDFRSIHEVVSRRFSRLVREGSSLPDIFLVDGGKGQLSAALEALESLGIEAPCVISLAKREEEVFLPGRSEPLRLSRSSFSLRLLEYVRDEAHRFAQHYHHLLRGKRTLEE